MMVRLARPPGWVVEEADWQPAGNARWESLCTVANGYLGVRGFPEEGLDAAPTVPRVFVAGVFEPGADGVPELARLSNLLSVAIRLEDRPFRMAHGHVSEYRRTLDLKRGLMQRSLVFTDDGRATRLEFERFASLANPHRLGQSITITPLNWSGRVGVDLWLDYGAGEDAPRHLRLLHAAHMSRDRILLATQTLQSQIRVAHACRCSAWVRQAAPPKPEHVTEAGRLGFRFGVQLECGQRAVFERLTVTYASRDEETTSVERCCLQDVRGPDGGAYGVHRRRHVRRWASRWQRADIAIDGPDDDQRALRFAIFHLIQACPQRDAGVSIAAKGLTGDGYRGHVFWDTEIFMLPHFIWTDPSAARRLLEYRVRTLDGARRKAREAGYDGAMFPWESADTGDEVCPETVPDPKTGRPVRVLTGRLQQHISADVVFAGWQYVQATGDQRFRERQLLALAVETARFWASRVRLNRRDGCYEIRNVIGPDEYHERIDNNAYTNFLAAWNLRLAAGEVEHMRTVHPRSGLLRRLRVGVDEPAGWRTIADGLRVPAGRNDGVWEQHAGFFDLDDADPHALSSRVSPEPEAARMRKVRRAQVLKQADVLMLMALFPDRFDPQTLRRNWDYYEPRTTHDSSLSPSVHAIVASDLGLTERAYDYFRLSALTDLADTMGNADNGLHAAAQGGTWQAVVRGFLGLRPEADAASLQVRPRLPAAWRRLVMRVHHRGRWYDVEATHDGARVRPRRGAKVPL